MGEVGIRWRELGILSRLLEIISVFEKTNWSTFSGSAHKRNVLLEGNKCTDPLTGRELIYPDYNLCRGAAPCENRSKGSFSV